MKTTIVEVLDFGQSLLSDGNILKADGTIISQQAYQEAQEMKARNKIDWIDIDVNEFVALLEQASFATKTYEINEDFGMSVTKIGFALIDKEGECIYLRSSEFSGSEQYQMANVTFKQIIYNVNKNSTEEVFDIMVDTLEEIFDTKEQVGSIFSPDDETTYKMKKFIKDGYQYTMVFKDGKLSNIKQGNKLHTQAEARPKASKIADMLNNNKFANLH